MSEDTEDSGRHYYSPSTKGFYIEGLTAPPPRGAVEITPAEYAALLQGQTDGGIISVAKGKPTLTPHAVDKNAAAMEEILRLEASITPRMLQEAAGGSAATGLGAKGSLTASEHLAAVRQQIDALRAKLKP